MLARGLPDAYGRKVNSSFILWPMCAIFIAGLLDWRRIRSMRTLDLIATLAFVASLVEFNHGDIFRATPLVYPPLIYLAARMVWVGTHGGPRRVRVGETHMLLLIALLFGLMGFRLGLNNQDSNVIDVGYAGVAGASRLMDGVLPYGHLPDKTSRPCAGSTRTATRRRISSRTGMRVADRPGRHVRPDVLPDVHPRGRDPRLERPLESLPAAHVTASAVPHPGHYGLFVAGRAARERAHRPPARTSGGRLIRSPSTRST